MRPLLAILLVTLSGCCEHGPRTFTVGTYCDDPIAVGSYQRLSPSSHRWAPVWGAAFLEFERLMPVDHLEIKPQPRGVFEIDTENQRARALAPGKVSVEVSGSVDGRRSSVFAHLESVEVDRWIWWLADEQPDAKVVLHAGGRYELMAKAFDKRGRSLAVLDITPPGIAEDSVVQSKCEQLEVELPLLPSGASFPGVIEVIDRADELVLSRSEQKAAVISAELRHRGRKVWLPEDVQEFQGKISTPDLCRFGSPIAGSAGDVAMTSDIFPVMSAWGITRGTCKLEVETTIGSERYVGHHEVEVSELLSVLPHAR